MLLSEAQPPDLISEPLAAGKSAAFYNELCCSRMAATACPAQGVLVSRRLYTRAALPLVLELIAYM